VEVFLRPEFTLNQFLNFVDHIEKISITGLLPGLIEPTRSFTCELVEDVKPKVNTGTHPYQQRIYHRQLVSTLTEYAPSPQESLSLQY
jgi:hypothetical protein